jgi:hypothetical protein
MRDLSRWADESALSTKFVGHPSILVGHSVLADNARL